MSLWSMLVEMLYPTCCPGCGKAMAPDVVWCEACLRKIWDPRVLNSSFTAHLSGCYTLCLYDGIIRECIIQLKYNGRIGRKPVFPPLLNRFPWWDRLSDCEMVIPVPLSKKKMRDRGYNQVDAMFEDWMKAHGKTYVPKGLVRIRNTGTQSLLSKQERYQNIKGVFHINHGVDVRGKTILLVDDVYTTGATMEAAAHELKTAGAAKVVGMTIASGAT